MPGLLSEFGINDPTALQRPLEGPGDDALKFDIAQLEAQIAQLMAGQQGGQPAAQPGGQPLQGLLSAGQQGGQSPANQMPPNQMQQIYGLLAQYGDNPAQVGQQYVQSMQGRDSLFGATSSPSSVREWEYYNSLPNEDKKAYLEMKRGINLKDLAGGQFGIYSGALGGSEQFTTLEEESSAATVMSAAKQTGTNTAQRYDILEGGRQGRFENYSVAKKIRELVSKNDLPTGLYTGLVYKVLPTGDQESLDALAEFVARARLKASGEIRPTDADVVGMKRALFGSGRTEEFTVESLDRLIRELEAQEDEYNTLGQFLGAPGYQRRPAQVSSGSPQIGVPSVAPITPDKKTSRSVEDLINQYGGT